MTGSPKITAKESPRDPEPGSPRFELFQRQDFPNPINKIRPEKGSRDLFLAYASTKSKCYERKKRFQGPFFKSKRWRPNNSPGQAFPNSGGD